MPTLNWIGKEAVVNHHNEVPFRLLKRNNALSVGDPGSGNLLVQGDNLEALKALLPYYAGQVKCIYIDPPYNTGNENWVYNDNVNSPEMKDWLGKVVGKDSEDLSRNDKWLCMMYPRLALLKDFLREDGAIFISIDDNEFHNLRMIMNDIFGTKNFINTIIWQKNYAPKSSAKHFSSDHDYILIFAKNAENFRPNLLPRTDKQNAIYKNPDNDPRGLWRPNNLAARNFYSKGTYSIKCPGGRIIAGPPKGSYWRVSEEKLRELDQDNRIWWGKDGNGIPAPKIFLSEVKQGIVPQTLWTYQDAGHTQDAKKELLSAVEFEDSKSVFITPKPVKLVKRIIRVASNSNDIILDSFAGSGTTGDAVIQLNSEDNGKRQCILVEMDSAICTSITAKRLEARAKDNNAGFSYCELGSTLFDAEGKIRDEVSFSELARHVYFSETGEPIQTGKNGKTPLLGVYQGRAVYLLYNGILKDKSVGGGNVLTGRILAELPPFAGSKVIYGTACRISAKRLKEENIVFKQTPYEIRIK